jgi:hypothetical protein
LTQNHQAWQVAPPPSIILFLALPKVKVVGLWRQPHEKPMIDYKKSSMMILKHSLTTLEQKVTKKKAPTKDRNARNKKKSLTREKWCLTK